MAVNFQKVYKGGVKMKRRSPRLSDLACECGRVASLPIKKEVEDHAFCTVTRVELGDSEANLTGRPAGLYASLFFAEPEILGEEERGEIVGVLADEIARVAKHAGFDGEGRILVAGLGNGEIIYDSFGRAVCKKTLPDDGIAVFAVGVPGQSGINSLEALSGMTKAAGASAVIVIDSLVARGVERVGRVIQINDGGVIPGSGVGRRECSVNTESLGVPTVSVGVPTALEFKGAEGFLAVSENLPSINEVLSEITSKAICAISNKNAPKME